jgi:hypothetical protein
VGDGFLLFWGQALLMAWSECRKNKWGQMTTRQHCTHKKYEETAQRTAVLPFYHTSNMCPPFTQFDISIWLLFIAIKSSQVPRKDHLSTFSFFPTLVKTLKCCLLL